MNKRSNYCEKNETINKTILKQFKNEIHDDESIRTRYFFKQNSKNHGKKRIYQELIRKAIKTNNDLK